MLRDSLGFGVKQCTPGTVIRDYHTSQLAKKERKVVHYSRRDELLKNPEKVSTVLSTREYICDTRYVVGLWERHASPIATLSDIHKALERPEYVLYFGRKSCPPAAPLHPQLISASTFKEALDSASFPPVSVLAYSLESQIEFALRNEKRHLGGSTVYYYWERENGNEDDTYTHVTQRYDQPLSRGRWQFGFRDEYALIQRTEEEDDVFQ